MTILASLLLAVATTADLQSLPSKNDVSLLQEVARAQERGLAWLAQQQETDGSWRHHPAMTALAITSFLRGGRP